MTFIKNTTSATINIVTFFVTLYMVAQGYLVVTHDMSDLMSTNILSIVMTKEHHGAGAVAHVMLVGLHYLVDMFIWFIGALFLRAFANDFMLFLQVGYKQYIQEWKTESIDEKPTERTSMDKKNYIVAVGLISLMAVVIMAIQQP